MSEMKSEKLGIHGWAKEWSLGCVNSRPTARGSQEAGFTQPRDHSFAQRCMWIHLTSQEAAFTQDTASYLSHVCMTIFNNAEL